MLNISESLKKQREQIMMEGGEELLSRHTSVLEIAVISMYNRLANRASADTQQFRSSAAVLAMGGLARGLTGPGQPVQLLLLTDDSSRWIGDWLEEIKSPLEEAGWKVEALQGDVDSLAHKAREDFALFLRLLQVRYISGNRRLVEKLDELLESTLEERRDEYLGLLHNSSLAREERLDRPDSWLEPDLENDPGALSEIASIRAACRIASNIRSLDDAIFRGYLTRQEVDLLQQAEKLYARVLSILQGRPGGQGGVIRFNDQEELANELGYSGRAGFLPVETFMQRLFQVLYGVRCVAREFWKRLNEIRAEAGGEAPPPQPLEDGIDLRNGKIHVQTGNYPATAGHLVHLFNVGAKHGTGFANTTRQWIRHNRNALDTASGDPMVRSELLALIRSDAADLPMVRKFYEQGLMISIIPELAPLQGLVQHDAFHLYPVDEHQIRTLREMKKVLAGEYASEEPELTRISGRLEDPTCLFLAGLLHDIGKSSGKDHARHGGEMIPAVARRLNLSLEDSDLLQFLVAEHLLLMDNASLRDLADPEMLAHCARAVGSIERLDLLALLSFADMAATGPKARQKWLDTPIMLLYDHIAQRLERGEPSTEAISERLDHVRMQVRRELGDLMDSEELEAFLAQLAPRYLLSVTPETISKHLRMQWRLQHSDEHFISDVSITEGGAEITLVSWDIPGLLCRSAGILTLHDMNINGAQVFAMDNSVTLLVFQCRACGGILEEFDREAVMADMKKLLLGRMALDYRMASHAAAGVKQKEQNAGILVPSTIKIDNESSGVFTILEVYTSDRIGLLYTISRTLMELQIRISVAKITTKVDQVADVFYIKTRDGHKVTDSEQIEEIKNALTFWLDGPAGR